MVNGNYSDSEIHDYGGGVIFKGNLNKNDLAEFIHISDAFTSEILKIWSEISYNGSITSIDHLLSLPLWQNSLVRIGNKPIIYYKSWSSKGIQNVKRLMKDADKFLSFTELKERFDVKTNFLVYHGLVSCIKLLRNAVENQNETNRNFSTFVENFIKAPKSNRLAYKKLVCAKQSSPTKSKEKWRADCSLQYSKTIDWEMAYKLPFYSTKATKLIIFQFKLLHGRLATNDFLNKIGIREDDICTFCRTEKESLFIYFGRVVRRPVFGSAL